VVPDTTVVRPVSAEEPATTGIVAIPETTTGEAGFGRGETPSWEAIAEAIGFGDGTGEGLTIVGWKTGTGAVGFGDAGVF
jgi:hypothetical protein